MDEEKKCNCSETCECGCQDGEECTCDGSCNTEECECVDCECSDEVQETEPTE